MKDKPITVFFGVVSWGIWAATISVIVFALVLLFTGMEKEPEFVLNSAAVQKVDALDPALLQNGKSGDDWYKLHLDMRVSAAKYSPFSYTADTLALRAPADMAKNAEWFVVLDAPLDFSKIAPDDFILDLYIRSSESAQALAEAARGFDFGLRGFVGHFTFINYPFYVNLPGFVLSDFGTPVSVVTDG